MWTGTGAPGARGACAAAPVAQEPRSDRGSVTIHRKTHTHTTTPTKTHTQTETHTHTPTHTHTHTHTHHTHTHTHRTIKDYHKPSVLRGHREKKMANYIHVSH